MTAGRINALADICGARRYLEVGVCGGETFFNVDVAYKVAVDPNFLFDYSSRESETTRFHPVTSDEFFKSTREQPFDLIYLDGLHTFEQNTRDFLNSLAICHPATLWLIDDTVPNDVFSVIPDQERCYRLRHKLVQGDWSWMGDVFKTVFFIERGLPRFDFRTFSGRGQTVVWNSKQARDIAPTGTGLERVGAMTYEDFIENLDVMRIEDDHAIYETVRRFANDAR